jgi:pimeloyl-ACP methyl ester carboxylesterase
VTLYFISGLGVDKRVFIKLQFPSSIKIRHLDWINPFFKETLQAYAKRIAQSINTTEEFSIIGLSFGGMIATEIAKFLCPKHVILLSSASTIKELPALYRLIGKLNLHKLIPSAVLKQPTLITYWFFDAVTKEEKQLLKAILKDTSPKLLSWAIDSILKWQNTKKPESVYHIHGSKDKVLPPSKIKSNKIVKGAGHLMVFSHATEINRLIMEKLQGGGDS